MTETSLIDGKPSQAEFLQSTDHNCQEGTHEFPFEQQPLERRPTNTTN
jgi:hypothetical protein